jgi:RNA polymerase sigma-70 factor (ECF subfamily)
MSSRAVSLPPFWRLVEEHSDELIRHARRLVGDDAEDVVHDALLKALRAYPGLTHGNHLRAWLYRVTTTTAFDLHRRRRREVPTDDLPLAPSEDSYDDGAFDSLIASLSAGAREAMVLRFVDDLAYDDIARKLGCSPVAARQRVSSGIRSLRRARDSAQLNTQTPERSGRRSTSGEHS